MSSKKGTLQKVNGSCFHNLFQFRGVGEKKEGEVLLCRQLNYLEMDEGGEQYFTPEACVK
jgi:hypothetical protein